MKTLNDTLREEFKSVISQDSYKIEISQKSLDVSLLYKAFDVLLQYKSDSDLRDKARSEYENFIINQIKSK